MMLNEKLDVLMKKQSECCSNSITNFNNLNESIQNISIQLLNSQGESKNDYYYSNNRYDYYGRYESESAEE